MPRVAAHDGSQRRSFRLLIRFWLVVLAVFAGGAMLLALTYSPPAPRVAVVPPLKREPSRLAVPGGAIPPPVPDGAIPPPVPDGAIPPPVPDGAIPPPDPALLEAVPGQDGWMLPRIGADGRTPSTFYAARVAGRSGPGQRLLALVVQGIGAPGLDEAASREAIEVLPAAVDLVYSAYMTQPGALADAARKARHECLVSVPMQPENGQISGGDHALIAGADAAINLHNLDYALAHVAGCVGATGASDGNDGRGFANPRNFVEFQPVVDRIQQRGLLYLDPSPLAGRLPVDLHVSVAIDAPPVLGEKVTRDEIEANLQQLAGIASAEGAIGLINLASMAGPAQVVPLQAIADWAKGLRDRNILLVPLSALAPSGLPARAAH